MSKIAAAIVSSLVAALASTVAIALFALIVSGLAPFRYFFLAVPTIFAIALAHTTLLLLPTAGLLIRSGNIRYWPMVLLGFLVGAIPVSILEWPAELHPSDFVHSNSSSDGGPAMFSIVPSDPKDTVIYDTGLALTRDWLGYGQSITFSGILGIIAAIAFYATYQRITRIAT